MIFKTIGKIPFTDPVLTQNGPKPLGECKFDEDVLTYRNKFGDRFRESVVLGLFCNGLEVAVPDEPDKKEEV